MVDGKSDDDHDGSFNFTTTDMTTAEMTNVNDKSRRMLALPPSDYLLFRSNDAEFLLDTADTNENLSWDKGLPPNESFPTELDASKCDNFEDPDGTMHF